jgi:hypothetical protein
MSRFSISKVSCTLTQKEIISDFPQQEIGRTFEVVLLLFTLSKFHSHFFCQHQARVSVSRGFRKELPRARRHCLFH